MGDKAKAWYERLITAKFTPAQYIIAIVSIVLFAFMNTDTFTTLPDIAKICFYASIMVLSMLFGAKLLDIKEKVQNIATVLKDTRLTPADKIAQITPLAIQILTALGIAFDMLNIEQDTQPKAPEVRDIPCVETKPIEQPKVDPTV